MSCHSMPFILDIIFVIVDELVKCGHGPDSEGAKGLIRQLMNEAMIYESEPGHYSTVR